MAGKPHREKALLADRLDHLFRTVHPKDRGPYTPAEVAGAINKAAGEKVISSTYVWQLRTGRRDNPTQKHLSALAAFFGVSPMYFFDDTETSRDAIPPELITALKDGRGPGDGTARSRAVQPVPAGNQGHDRKRPRCRGMAAEDRPAGPARDR